MPTRREVQPRPLTRTVEQLKEFVLHPVGGQVATDGVVYSGVATVGTTAIEVFSKVIDPGIDLMLTELELGLTQRFNNLNTLVASLSYYWRARQSNAATLGAWVGLTPTISKGVPTSSVVEDTFSGYFSVGTLPEAPVEISLMAVALVASSFAADVKNSSYARLVGIVIPGT